MPMLVIHFTSLLLYCAIRWHLCTEATEHHALRPNLHVAQQSIGQPLCQSCRWTNKNATNFLHTFLLPNQSWHYEEVANRLTFCATCVFDSLTDYFLLYLFRVPSQSDFSYVVNLRAQKYTINNYVCKLYSILRYRTNSNDRFLKASNPTFNFLQQHLLT